MRIGLAILLATAACTGAPPTTERPTPAEPSPAPAASRGVTAPASAAAGVPWRPAWPAGDGRVALADSAPGRLLGHAGLTTLAATGACGELHVADGSGALWLPPGPEEAYPPAPVVSAALVERASWRLADVLGPGPGITPGVDAPDPALHHGIRVRSIRKVRRQGPPWQVVVGERHSQVVVALTDKDATQVHAGLVVERTRDGLVELASLPAFDLDDDGQPEIVVVGDGPDGGLRYVLSADLDRGALTLRSADERGLVSCLAP